MITTNLTPTQVQRHIHTPAGGTGDRISDYEVILGRPKQQRMATTNDTTSTESIIVPPAPFPTGQHSPSQHGPALLYSTGTVLNSTIPTRQRSANPAAGDPTGEPRCSWPRPSGEDQHPHSTNRSLCLPSWGTERTRSLVTRQSGSSFWPAWRGWYSTWAAGGMGLWEQRAGYRNVHRQRGDIAPGTSREERTENGRAKHWENSRDA